MHSIQTKFKPRQMVWLVSMHYASVKKVKINCVSVNDYGDKVNIDYQVRNNWYEEAPNKSGGLFATKNEAEAHLLQGLLNFNALKMQIAQEDVKFHEEQLERAKATLAELSAVF